MNKKGHLATSIGTFTAIPILYVSIYSQLPSKINSYIEPLMTTCYNIQNIIHNPLLFILYLSLVILGARIPDLDLLLKHLYPKSTPQFYYHRQITHSLLLHTAIMIYAIYLHNSYIFYIEVGIFSHLMADMLTGSIPIGLYGAYYSYWSRIGITTVLPKQVANKISKSIVKIADKYYIVIIIISIMIYIAFMLLRYSR